MKLKEEEQRAVRYLETRKGCDSVAVVSYMNLQYICRNCLFKKCNEMKLFGLGSITFKDVAFQSLEIVKI